MAVPIPTPDVASLIGTAISKPEPSKFLAKLVDTIGHGIGVLYEPTAIRRKAKANADAAKVTAQADAEIALIKEKNKSDIEILRIDERVLVREARDRAKVRLTHQEERRQENMEAIVSKAALQEPETVEDQKVEEDWVAQFIDNSKDVSNEDMQTLWARILAGEIAKPGSFSLRTLGLVRTMTRNEADLFTRFCSTVWELEEGKRRTLRPLVYRMEELESMPGIHLGVNDLYSLASMGLVRFGTLHGKHITFRMNLNDPDPRSPVGTRWNYHESRYIFTSSISHVLRRERGGTGTYASHAFPTGTILLTDIGSELARISGSQPNDLYLVGVIEELRHRGWNLTLGRCPETTK